jgi:uncharacterized protein YhbP (UPF0306 family)
MPDAPSQSPQALRLAVRELLEAHNTLTLATCGPDGPWAAAVFFASDDDLNLYFVSDQRTRHGRDLVANGRAAGSLNPDCDDWKDIRGLQLEGAVSILDGAARDAALTGYLAKFPRVRSLYEQPRDEDEARIAERLRKASLFRLKPNRIRLIDNERGFGFKAELRLPEDVP